MMVSSDGLVKLVVMGRLADRECDEIWIPRFRSAEIPHGSQIRAVRTV
jgi:hypothetical protein